jgi:hypothetical protein
MMAFETAEARPQNVHGEKRHQEGETAWALEDDQGQSETRKERPFPLQVGRARSGKGGTEKWQS